MTDPCEPADAMVFECEFDEPPEKVWRALTQRELLDAWLTNDEDGAERTRKATEYEVLEAEPHRLLRYGCRDRNDARTGAGATQVRETTRTGTATQEILESIVTFELSPSKSGGTHLRLTHGDFRIVAQVQRPSIVCALARARSARVRKTPITSCLSSFAWRKAA